MFLTGHCDTSGTADYNVALSRHRVDVVAAALLGNRESFGAEADGPHLKTKEEKATVQQKDRIQVLEWVAVRLGWPTSLAQNGGDYFRAVRSFQRSWNENGKAGNVTAPDLAVDSEFGPNTWRAVYDCYQLAIAQMLDIDLGELRIRQQQLSEDGRWVDPAHRTVGCGESQPVDAPGVEYRRSETNRRVEILFFDNGEEPSPPCFSGQCVPEQCDLYRGGYQWQPIPVDPRRDKLIGGWTQQTLDAVGNSLEVELSGPTIPTQLLTAAQGWKDGDTVRFTFEEFDRLATCTLHARNASSQCVLWTDQFVLPTNHPFSKDTMQALIASTTLDARPPPPNTPGNDPQDQPAGPWL